MSDGGHSKVRGVCRLGSDASGGRFRKSPEYGSVLFGLLFQGLADAPCGRGHVVVLLVMNADEEVVFVPDAHVAVAKARKELFEGHRGILLLDRSYTDFPVRVIHFPTRVSDRFPAL